MPAPIALPIPGQMSVPSKAAVPVAPPIILIAFFSYSGIYGNLILFIKFFSFPSHYTPTSKNMQTIECVTIKRVIIGFDKI